MIRPFDWRDVSLVKQLSDQGICLDAIARLTRGSQPLQNALFAYLMPGMGAPTLIWKDQGRSAFGQLRHRPGDEQARALFIAPGWAEEPDGWLQLVDQLSVEAGERGGHNLIAEIDETSSEFEALRMAGFAIYARQSIWQLIGDPPATVPALALRPATSADALNVNVLYANIVPRLIQQVEPPPAPVRGYVLEIADELVAFLDVRRGPLGIWVEPYVHPQADHHSAELVNSALHVLASANRAGRPIYVVVRRYQDWLQDILQSVGFEYLGSQAVMVKRLAVRVTKAVRRPLPSMEGKATTTTPMAGIRLKTWKN